MMMIGLINQYPKMKNSSLSSYFLKKHMKVIKELSQENASEFESAIKINCLFNSLAFALPFFDQSY